MDDSATNLTLPRAWADAWGDDRHGLWIALTYQDARQVFRWMEPILITGIFTSPVVNGFVVVSPSFQPAINDVLVGVHLSPGFHSRVGCATSFRCPPYTTA